MGFATRYTEYLDNGSQLEFNALLKFLKQFLLREHNEDGTHIVAAGTTLDQTLPYVTVGNVSTLTNERALVGTSNEVDITDNGAGTTVAVGLPSAVTLGASLSVPIIYMGASAGSGTATSSTKIIKKVTGIADNTATDVFTVTVPNANHAAVVKVTFLSSNGSTDAFESSRVADGNVVLARTTGANVVAAVSALTGAQIATVAAGATHTLAYDLSAISGAADASNSFTIRVTIDDSGNLGANQVVAIAELLNSETTGVTIA